MWEATWAARMWGQLASSLSSKAKTGLVITAAQRTRQLNDGIGFYLGVSASLPESRANGVSKGELLRDRSTRGFEERGHVERPAGILVVLRCWKHVSGYRPKGWPRVGFDV